jgi:hypothetical protein
VWAYLVGGVLGVCSVGVLGVGVAHLGAVVMQILLKVHLHLLEAPPVLHLGPNLDLDLIHLYLESQMIKKMDRKVVLIVQILRIFGVADFNA